MVVVSALPFTGLKITNLNPLFGTYPVDPVPYKFPKQKRATIFFQYNYYVVIAS